MPNPVINRRLFASMGTVARANLPQLSRLVLRLESLDFNAATNGSNVTTWSDHSGLGHDFNLTGGLIIPATAPTVDGARLCNGNKTVRFAGSNGIGCAPFAYNAVDGVEMMAVWQSDSATPAAGNRMFELLRPGNGTEAIQPFSDGNFYESFARTDRPSLGKPSVISITSFCVYNLTAKSDSSLYSAWMNSENFYSSNTFTFNGTQGANNTTVGVEYNGLTNLYAAGNVAAVYVWQSSLSAADRLLARDYISRVWGIVF